MFKNALFQIHWFVGITAGVVLGIVGLTGAMLSFEHQIVDWLNRDVRFVEARAQAPLPAPALLARIAAASPGKRITALSIENDPESAVRVTFAPERRAEGGQGGAEGGRGPRGESRYVNPYTGEVLQGEANRGEGFFRGTRSLHRWLVVGAFGDRDVGRQIVGASTLLCLLLALSGIYLRWPQNGHTWRNWLALDFSLQGRSFLWNLHAAIGTWVLFFYLLMCLTGLQWSYEWYRNGLYAIAGVERPAARGGEPRAGERGGGERGGSEREPSATPNITPAWHAFESATRNTGYRIVNIDIAIREGSQVQFRYLDADPAHERAFNSLVADAQTGMVTKHERYDDKPVGGKLVSSIFPLHTGSFFGLPGVIVYMLASLAMPLFTITGWMMYLVRRERKARARLRKEQEILPVTES
jgi:sulfite reductase (NADPH) flavoprotein alpha-component